MAFDFDCSTPFFSETSNTPMPLSSAQRISLFGLQVALPFGHEVVAFPSSLQHIPLHQAFSAPSSLTSVVFRPVCYQLLLAQHHPAHCVSCSPFHILQGHTHVCMIVHSSSKDCIATCFVAHCLLHCLDQLTRSRPCHFL